VTFDSYFILFYFYFISDVVIESDNVRESDSSPYFYDSDLDSTHEDLDLDHVD